MRAKKSLGQNFLKSEVILEKIVETAGITKEEVILEIGPGRGALTEKLIGKAGCVVAVEKDDELFEFLQERFSRELVSESLILIHGDILELDTDGIFKNNKYKIVANIPYNITGAILKKFLTARSQPRSLTLMVQKEVGERIVARDGKESLLSISVKAYGKPSLAMRVGREYFRPRPKVDSVVLKIDAVSREFFQKNSLNEKRFWQVLHAGFAHKRKVLSGNLRSLNMQKKDFPDKFSGKRAEDLHLDDWATLARE